MVDVLLQPILLDGHRCRAAQAMGLLYLSLTGATRGAQLLETGHLWAPWPLIF